MATPNKHAFLSASSAHRWLACTAAPHFEAQFEDGTSEYAEEGTLAHSFCELYGQHKFNPTVMTKRKFNFRVKKLQENPLYNPEMLTCAEEYVDFIQQNALGYENKPHIAQEVKVDFSEFVPEGFGTCDCIIIGGDTLCIIDYKHGKGVAVSAQENPQMRLYALGALAKYTPIYGDSIKKVCTGIFQPRINNISAEVLSADELRAWGESIKPLAEAAYSGNGSAFIPGEHCRFCKGRAKCRARAEQHTALEDFKDCVPESAVEPAIRDKCKNLTPEQSKVLGLPPVLSDEEIGELLTRGKQLVSWYNDLCDYAQKTILAGKTIPNWKVVEGRSNRAFKDVDEVINRLVAAGYDEAMCYEKKPLTLTNFEKLTGKKQFEELISDLVVKPQGKPTLVPESDKRPPYSSAASDFAEVSNNGESN